MPDKKSLTILCRTQFPTQTRSIIRPKIARLFYFRTHIVIISPTMTFYYREIQVRGNNRWCLQHPLLQGQRRENTLNRKSVEGCVGSLLDSFSVFCGQFRFFLIRKPFLLEISRHLCENNVPRPCVICQDRNKM